MNLTFFLMTPWWRRGTKRRVWGGGPRSRSRVFIGVHFGAFLRVNFLLGWILKTTDKYNYWNPAKKRKNAVNGLMESSTAVLTRFIQLTWDCTAIWSPVLFLFSSSSQHWKCHITNMWLRKRFDYNMWVCKDDHTRPEKQDLTSIYSLNKMQHFTFTWLKAKLLTCTLCILFKLDISN